MDYNSQKEDFQNSDNQKNTNIQNGYQQSQYKHPKVGFCITSLVLSILSLVIVLCPNPNLTIPLGVLALIFGVIANKAKKSGMGTAGFVMSIISLALVLLRIILNE